MNEDELPDRSASQQGSASSARWLPAENGSPDAEQSRAATRIALRPHDPGAGEEIDKREVVKGYEYGRGQFVTFTPEELKALDGAPTPNSSLIRSLMFWGVAPAPGSRPQRRGSISASSSPVSRPHRPSIIYETIYGARGQAENLIKLHNTQLASDRTSCRSPLANQMRLILHTAAYWLILTVRDAIPKAHLLATAEFATIRLRLLKLGTRVIETASRYG